MHMRSRLKVFKIMEAWEFTYKQEMDAQLISKPKRFIMNGLSHLIFTLQMYALIALVKVMIKLKSTSAKAKVVNQLYCVMVLIQIEVHTVLDF